MQPGGTIYVITGDRGSGKSTACARVAREASRRGLDVAGILTERSSPGQGAARKVIDLRSGETRPFGSQPSREIGPASDPLTPGWQFDSEVFAWANQVFSCSTPCDLLVVDEVGPLELLGGRGWAEALGILRSRNFGAALVVCRPGLLGELEACLGSPPSRVFEVDPQTRDTAPAAITMEVLPRAAGA